MAKNPLLVAFLSFLWPGLGEIYTGKVLMVLGLIFLSLILSTVTIVLTLFSGILYIVVWALCYL